MAKKPNYAKSMRRRNNRDLAELLGANKHHVLHQRSLWNTLPPHETLRNDPDLIVLMDEAVHKELHRSISPIPPLGTRATRCLLDRYGQMKKCHSNLRSSKQGVYGIDMLIKALEAMVNDPDCHLTDLEVLQIKLMIMNLRQQAQFIVRSCNILRMRCTIHGIDLGLSDLPKELLGPISPIDEGPALGAGVTN